MVVTTEYRQCFCCVFPGKVLQFFVNLAQCLKAMRCSDANVVPLGSLCDVQEAVEEVLGHTEEVYRA